MKHVRDFIAKVHDPAKAVNREFGVPYGVIIAQAALETGWGRYVKGNNYFGIKGEGQDFQTHEYINGVRVTLVDSFRKYQSLADSFRDYGYFLRNNPRYDPCFAHTDDPRQFAKALQKAGYATDPTYADKLIAIMKRWDLLTTYQEEAAPERKVLGVAVLYADAPFVQFRQGKDLADDVLHYLERVL